MSAPVELPTPASEAERKDPRTFVAVMRLWEAYRELALPAEASLIQIVESRRAFFAGAKGIFDQMTKDDGQTPDEELVGRLTAWAEEFEDWGRIASQGLDTRADKISARRVYPGELGPKQ